MRIILIRHGDPDYEKDSLTEKGWREAELLAKRVSQWKAADFYCSPLGRAQDTARISLQKRNQTAVTLDWLCEFPPTVEYPNSGDKHIAWDMLPRDWTQDKKLYDKDEWDKADVMKTGAVEEAYSKVKHGLDQLLASYGYERCGNFYKSNPEKKEKKNDTIVLFCHFGITMVILAHLLGISASVLWHGFFLAPTSVTVLNAEECAKKDAYFRCQVLGDTRHLSDGGEKISQSGYFAEIFQQ